MKKILTILVPLMLSVPALSFADQIEVKVNGMVCSFCAQGIEKKFKTLKEVKSVKVDLDQKLVSITTDKGVSLPEAKVKNFIIESGFAVEDLKVTK